ncbi:uncharacterized protein SPSK_04839 [Sporothrix schenckii 1099-18]|uniref:Uncharacterized protein n=2 Tax=Sporothrix schenckii TaxID=29908 RepID=U7Q2G4_SPOS1|nr:uncharacterized protein SPSK_04839 [Sporothrix schenckii 1099-18]ERT02043.1 hypothetical protein HMPREF1624_00339 [Sporothrix schenckii ATCC 58251]KJR80761.1 hypothetical protein SPSK_04839 [Sporothrix schenckii 1099-18]
MSEPPPAHTPSFRGRGRGRGRSQAVRAHVARLAQARKAANGRRGRQKLYDHPKPQAASERLKELKAAFSAVANAMRPALEDLADRSLDQLKSRPDAYRAFDQFQEVKDFLDRRIHDVQTMHRNKLLLDTRLNDYIFAESRTITEEAFIRDVEDTKDRFYDAQLQRLEILDKLHDNELPIDIIDDSWNFHEISDERFRDVKAHVEYRTTPYGAKVEVPCAKMVTGRRLAGTPTTSGPGAGAGDDNSLKPSPKRKADDEADILPPPKRLGAAPRHIGGLLSAVVAPTDEDEDDDAEADTRAGSKMPSPSPALAEEDDEMLDEDENGTPLDDDDESNTHLRPSERLPPLPNGASEPDAFGVRLINKRRTANFDVYNRILVPSLFDFEPHEIGFRDSTNDKSRGATKIKRGRFLDTPNSNTMHFDRSLWQYDATTYDEGELDEELIKKHNLHQKYGLVLRTSVNDEEPPKARVSGMNPVVFYTPRGRTLNSSRSIRIARLEDGAEIASKRPAMAAAVDQFAEKEGVTPAAIHPADEVLETFRQEKLKLWLGPRRVTRDETEELEERIEEMVEGDYAMEEDEDRKVIVVPPRTPDRTGQFAAEDIAAGTTVASVEDEEQSAANAMAAKAMFGTLLDAAAAMDTDAAEDTARPRSSDDVVSHVSQASPLAARRATSRPFDPVRDVFMDTPATAPADDSASDRRQGSTDYILPPSSARSSQAFVDTSNLLYMATVALDQEFASPYHQQQQPPPPASSSSMRYPPARGSAPYDYPPTDSGPNNGYRRMSMDPPQPYHSHHQPPRPPPQHATPPQQPQNLLDPRLFGEAPQPQQQLPPPISNRDANNGYSSGPYYQPPPPPPAGYIHSSHHHGGSSYPPPGPSTDPYGPPPPPSAAYGQPPSRGNTQYYMSPPPPQHQQLPLQQQSSQSQSLPMMRPYDTRYGPPRGESEGPLPPPSASSYGSQGLPPLMAQQPPAPSHANSPSPQMYAGQLSSTSYSRGGSREYQPHHQHEFGSSMENGPSNGDYPPGPESNGNNGNNKYRKLEPAPMIVSKSNEWSTGGDRDRDGNRDSVSSNGHTSDGRPLARGSEEPTNAYATSSVGKEFRTVPYDYEKIKDYAAIEPPPSQGPKSIRGWAHNSLKRGGSGTTTTVSKAMSSTVSAMPPIKAEGAPTPVEWDADEKHQQQQ